MGLKYFTIRSSTSSQLYKNTMGINSSQQESRTECGLKYHSEILKRNAGNTNAVISAAKIG